MSSDMFSKEIPELLTNHLEHLKTSAISLDVIKERGYKTVMGKAELKALGFGVSQRRAPGILIPLHGTDGNIVGYQLRPDHPRKDTKRDRVIKYENPLGASVRIDVPPRCRQTLGNPAIPLWITEGVKKVDALATFGACAIGLTGVWGFKGKNMFGGTSFLADFDYITLKGRLVYMVFDSDSKTNPQVGKALARLSEHLSRKGANVRILNLPSGPAGEKVGADDYLAQGHTLKDIIGHEESVKPSYSNIETVTQRAQSTYCVEEGKICWRKASQHGGYDLVPLCNFDARIIEDMQKDNGNETTRCFRISGLLDSGDQLPIVDVPASSFSSMAWTLAEWGGDVVIASGQTAKDRLREAIQLKSIFSGGIKKRVVYTHTGWREIGGKMVYLIGTGCVGEAEVETELEPQFERYYLPKIDSDAVEAFNSSQMFLYVGDLAVTLPVWVAMYLAPLNNILNVNLSMWYVGESGSFKSTLNALALSHFGDFDTTHLPVSWSSTANQLERYLFIGKDLPVIIDDWAPGQDNIKAKELEVKAERIIRAQANRQGRNRLGPDTIGRHGYQPRGLLITSGEQLPGGYSHNARIFSVPIEREDINTEYLSEQQQSRHMYRQSMVHYLTWMIENYAKLESTLPRKWVEWRDKSYVPGIHPRMPEMVAHLMTGMETVMDFALEKGAVSETEHRQWLKTSVDIFMDIVKGQGVRVEEERPGKKFRDGLQASLNMGRSMLRVKDEEPPRQPGPGQIAVGWLDSVNGHILLDPLPSYMAVVEYYARSGNPFTIKEDAVWKDLKRIGYIECPDNRTKYQMRLNGQLMRVINMKKSVLGYETSPSIEEKPEEEKPENEARPSSYGTLL